MSASPHSPGDPPPLWAAQSRPPPKVPGYAIHTLMLALAAHASTPALSNEAATGAPMTHVPKSSSLTARATPAGAVAVVDFWRAAGPTLWFAKDANFDRRFRERFLSSYEAAARGDLAGWRATADGALALVILLDQFPRNAFRGTPRMYATDTMAREIADAAIGAGHDRAVDAGVALFFYLPFGHSENLADQERSVALNRRLGQPNLSHAERHRDIVQRFGRFPHRNPILGRAMTKEEQHYLGDGGYAG